MNQRPRTIQEQLTRLKEKGMVFYDEQIAISYLTRISYFRLKYYWVDMLDVNTGRQELQMNLGYILPENFQVG